jgi:hypothetical protein
VLVVQELENRITGLQVALQLFQQSHPLEVEEVAQ